MLGTACGVVSWVNAYSCRPNHLDNIVFTDSNIHMATDASGKD